MEKLLGSKLRDARKALSLRVEEVAYRLGITVSTVYAHEQSKNAPNSTELFGYADLYQVSVEQLRS